MLNFGQSAIFSVGLTAIMVLASKGIMAGEQRWRITSSNMLLLFLSFFVVYCASVLFIFHCVIYCNNSILFLFFSVQVIIIYLFFVLKTFLDVFGRISHQIFSCVSNLCSDWFTGMSNIHMYFTSVWLSSTERKKILKKVGNRTASVSWELVNNILQNISFCHTDVKLQEGE